MDIIGKLNPLCHMSFESYIRLWQYLFANLLQGFWSRLIAVSFLGLSFWFGVRRRNLSLGVAFFIMTLFITYAAPLVRFAGLL